MRGAWHSLAWLAVVLVALSPTAVLGVPPLPQPPRLVAAVVPANGVVGVRLPDSAVAESLKDGSIVLRVTDQTGVEVAGEVVSRLAYYAVFHPAEALIVGASYTLQLRDPDPPTGFVPKHAWTTPLQFSVAGARDSSDGVPNAEIAAVYLDIGATSESCCGGGSCFVIATREGVLARLTAEIQGEASTVGQYVYAFDWEKNHQPHTSRGWSVMPEITVPQSTRDGPPFEPCRLLHAYSLADDTEHLLGGGCVEAERVVPEAVQLFPVDDKLAFGSCKEPPWDLIDRWCDVNFDQCNGDEVACPGYAWRCVAHSSALRAEHANTIAPEQAGCRVSIVRAHSTWAWLVLLAALRGLRTITRSSRQRLPR